MKFAFKKLILLMIILLITGCTVPVTNLKVKQNEIKHQLTTFVSLDEYSLTNQLLINDLLEEGKNLIDSARTVKDIDLVFSEVKLKILAIKTLSQEISDLESYRTTAISKLNTYVENKRYSDENKLLITEEIKSTIHLMINALSSTEIDEILALSYNRIDQIPLFVEELNGLIEVNENYLAGGGEILTHSLTDKTLLIDELGLIKYSAQTKVYRVVNNEVVSLNIGNLYLGMQNVYYYFNKATGLVDYILINGDIKNDIIKVFINQKTNIAGDNDRYHNTITLSSQSDIKIGIVDSTEKTVVSANTPIYITLEDNKVVVTINNNKIISSNQMVLVKPTSAKIKVNSITRSQGNPEYYGSFEIQAINNRLQLVNNVLIEDYLKTVVPSEMPSSWLPEALKVQAICARTYALADVFKTTYFNVGYHVDDSVMSQVYNNTTEQKSTNQAIIDTKGIVMQNKGTLISAVFFSTSSGATGLPGDAWFTGIYPKPDQSGPYKSAIYAKDLSGNDIIFDINDEGSMLSFYKLINFDTYDKSSSFHRWRYSPTKTELINQLQTTLKERFTAVPDQVLTFSKGQYESLPIANNIGTFVNLEVSGRGAGGLITSIDITTSLYRFRVYREYNIRLLFRNINFQTATADQKSYNATRTNFNFLPSAYFAVETIGDTVYFFGGGWGHGTGMSQYGANEMAKRNLSYQTILNHYYHNLDFITWVKETEEKINLITVINLFS